MKFFTSYFHFTTIGEERIQAKGKRERKREREREKERERERERERDAKNDINCFFRKLYT